MDVGPPRTPPPPRRPQENTIKLHKNGQVATVLYTRVRTTVVFSKLNFKISLLVRTRVQSIAFKRQNFDFESAFAVLFESTAKPQREAQKRLSEGNNCNITGIFQ